MILEIANLLFMKDVVGIEIDLIDTLIAIICVNLDDNKIENRKE